MVHNDMAHDKDGFEILDDTPVTVPVKFRQAPGEVDRLRSMMAQLVVDMRSRHDVETFEESLDFDVDDDDDELSRSLSRSETRYMKEEVLLTEHEEAERIRLQRRAAYEWRKRNGHVKDPDGAERVRDGDGRSRDASNERREERKSEGRSGEAASGGAGSSKGSGEPAS